jgi:TadE-like protein
MVHIKQPWRSSKGQNVVEFALLAPIVFIFLFAIIDFGVYLNQRTSVEHAVREGARYAAVHVGCTDIQGRTQSQAPSVIPTAQANSIVGVRYPTPAAGGMVEVYVKPTPYPLPIIGPALHTFGINIGSISLSASAWARLEMSVTGAEANGCGPAP